MPPAGIDNALGSNDMILSDRPTQVKAQPYEGRADLADAALNVLQAGNYDLSHTARVRGSLRIGLGSR
jgi:hypothetical protein